MNVEQLYYSRENFNLLNSTIKSFVRDKYKTNINDEFQQKLFNTMEFVESKVGLNLPPGINPKKFIKLMNKKVLKLFLPKISENFKNNKPPPKKTKKTQFNQFENISQNHEQFDPKLPLPQMSHNDVNISEQYQNLQNTRNNEYQQVPPQENFEQKVQQDVADKDAVHKYEQLIQNRQFVPQQNNNSELDKLFMNNQAQIDTQYQNNVENMTNFDEQNNQMNEHLQNINLKTHIEKIIPDNNVNSEIMDDHMKEIHSLNMGHREDYPIQENFNIQHDFQKQDQNLKDTFNKIVTRNANLDGSYPLIQPGKVAYKERKQYLTVDSIDRDFELYPNPTNFRVQFNAESNSLKHITKNIVVGGQNRIFYQGAIREEGIRAAPIMETFKNIKSIKLVNMMMPVTNNGIYKFDDEPYLLVDIKELENKYSGTNLANNRAFTKVTPYNYNIYNNKSDQNISKFAKLRADENNGFEYSPAPLANLNSFTLDIKTNRNDNYSIGNDKLDILAVAENEITVPCSKTGCSSTNNYLHLLVCLKRHQGMNEQELFMEAIHNETIYFFCKNTCYLNQYFNFDVLESSDIVATLSTDSLTIVEKIDCCDDGVQEESRPVMFSNLINPNQILQINGGRYKFTGTTLTNGSIQLTELSAGTYGNISQISISEINEKGFTSRDCCDINYERGFKILPYNIVRAESCRKELPSDIAYSHPGLFSGVNILTAPVAGFWDQTTGCYCDKFYSTMGIECCGSSDTYYDLITPVDELYPIHYWYNYLIGNRFTSAQITNAVNHCNILNEKCIERHYLQSFTMIKPSNFDVTNFSLGDIFLVRKRKQLSYTFEITTVEQDRGTLNAKII